MSAAMKDPLEEIVGQGRSLPLFDHVSGPGNNATYSIVGFAGVRIMDVKLTGAMNNKHLVIQPAIVVDRTVITDPSADTESSFVHSPPRLVR